MIRYAKMKDIPQLSKQLRLKACYLTERYKKMLPVLVMMQHVLIFEKNGLILGILGFSLEGSLLTIDCIYSYTDSQNIWSEVVRALLTEVAQKYASVDNLQIDMLLDCIGNPAMDTQTLKSMGFRPYSISGISSLCSEKFIEAEHVLTASSIDTSAYKALLNMALENYDSDDFDFVQDQLLKSRKDTLILKVNSELVGLATLRSVSGNGSGFAKIHYFYVASEYAKTSYCKELIEAARKHAFIRGARFLEIEQPIDSIYSDYLNSFDPYTVKYTCNYSDLRTKLLKHFDGYEKLSKETAFFC